MGSNIKRDAHPPGDDASGPERSLFDRSARWAERQVGRSATFILAIVLTVVWAATGPIFHFSDTWQLVINTTSSVVTFLMVFLIQNTQNRDTQAIHLKLDELIRVSGTARNSMMALEERSEGELREAKSEFTDLAEKTAKADHAEAR